MFLFQLPMTWKGGGLEGGIFGYGCTFKASPSLYPHLFDSKYRVVPGEGEMKLWTRTLREQMENKDNFSYLLQGKSEWSHVFWESLPQNGPWLSISFKIIAVSHIVTLYCLRTAITLQLSSSAASHHPLFNSTLQSNKLSLALSSNLI